MSVVLRHGPFPPAFIEKQNGGGQGGKGKKKISGSRSLCRKVAESVKRKEEKKPPKKIKKKSKKIDKK